MQQFTQKYTIVQLLEDVPEGVQFSADKWTLHVTIADTFAVDWDVATMVDRLSQLVHAHPAASSVVEDDKFFGSQG